MQKKNRKRRKIGGTPIYLKLLIGLIFGYILVHVVLYEKNDKTAIYEVRAGYLSHNNVLRGLCIRDEEIVKSKKSGHINYFVSEGDRVGVNSIVYSLDNDGAIYEYIRETKEDLDDFELRGIRAVSRDFSEHFSPYKFEEVLHYRSRLDIYLTNIKADKALSKLKKLDEKTSLSFSKHKADSAGNIAFYTDGFEGKSEAQIDYSDMIGEDYQKKVINNNDSVKKGGIVYKLLKNERWKLLCPLDDETYNQLDEIIRNKDNLNREIQMKVKFLEDSTYTNCSLKLEKKANHNYAVLTFADSAVRFLNHRYLDIELQLKQNVGLQIPITAIVQKSFYKVPEEFIDKGGNKLSDSASFGVLKKLTNVSDNKIDKQFVELGKVPRGEGFAYIPTDKFEDSQIIVSPLDNKTEYLLSDKVSMNGVYNINKGYAVFNYVEIIDKNDQYYIVDDKKSVLSEYDHIILEGKAASENMILNQKGGKK